ncbi:site-specific integrase [Mangrovibacterium lignilyticum]|uniref:site-specific integrase n=1 Tax=Mangrovibacterium lignilyticum TaxID=2668052 RepID=UPI0013D5F45A|nr:site-specific integrase [Mangrovibacterium lignilyticum]
MEKVNYAVSFQLKKNKSRKSGEAPVYLRITVDGERFETATNKFVSEKQWDSRLQQVKGRSEEAQITNKSLEELKNQINRYHNQFVASGKNYSIDDFKVKLKSGKSDVFTLVQVFQESNKLVEQSLGHKYSQSTYNQYVTTLDRLKSFLKKHYKSNDFELAKLDISFISRFENFLLTEYGLSENTVAKYLKQLKKVLHYAQKLRYIRFDPFFGYQTSYKEVDRGYLTLGELKTIETKTFRIKRLGEVRDVFVFVCYTGLSYSDLKHLTRDNLAVDINGRICLRYERQKTGVRATVPLLSQAKAIIDKYAEDPECIADEKLLPIRSNQKLNSYLGEIAELCEINKHITMHLGRHTFATTVTLQNGVSIESVKQMLAHKNLSTTQIYARTTDTKVIDDMSKLEKRLQGGDEGQNDERVRKIM